MGLLDALNSGDPGLLGALAIMSAGQAQPQRQSLGGGLLAGMQVSQQARQAQEDRAMKQLLMQAQIGDMQAQQQQRAAQAQDLQRKAAEAARQREILQRVFGPVTGTQANAVSGITGPRPEALGVVGQQQQPNYQQLLADGIPLETVKGIAEARNFGRDKVARVEDTMVDGRPVKRQFDEFGRPVGEALPQWKAPMQMDTGGQTGLIDPVTGAFVARYGKTNTPDALLSAATTRRGQDMTDARQRESNSTAAAAVGKVDWKQDVNGSWIGLPKEVSGQGPVTPIPVNAMGKREFQSRNALDIINAAEGLLDKATGSYLGAGVDLAGRAIGVATPGAIAGGQLKALQGALMMAQPRMEGPQSDKDTLLYQQMAAQIGDPTVPVEIKKAALGTIKGLHGKYAGLQGQPSAPPQQAGGAQRISSDAEYNALPSGSTFTGPDGKLRRKP